MTLSNDNARRLSRNAAVLGLAILRDHSGGDLSGYEAVPDDVGEIGDLAVTGSKHKIKLVRWAGKLPLFKGACDETP